MDVREDRAVHDLGAMEIGRRLGAGSLTAESLVGALMARAELLDVGETGLRSLIEWNPDALASARAMDREHRETGRRGPLSGVPVMIKDNIATADGMHTTAGSKVLEDLFSPIDASLVTRLREAGAVLIAKTNLTEWANWVSDHMPNGFSYRGGQTRNPYGPGRFDTGGSSSGSAVAVTAGLAPLSVGTETSGSILSPASQNGVVGIKPTVGLVSRYGIVPISPSQDTAGPMARTVEDAALLLEILAGPDPRDPVTLSQPSAPDGHGYVEAAGEGTLEDRVLGVVRNPYWEGVREDRRIVAEEALKCLARAGARIRDPISMPDGKREWGLEILRYEFPSALGRFLAEMGGRAPVRTLQEIIAFHHANPETVPYGQALFVESAATSGRLVDPAYLRARRQYQTWAREEGIDATLDGGGLDALLFVNASGAYLGATAGYPSVSVPVGLTAAGEPVGLTFLGRRFDERRLVELAGAFERALRQEGRGRMAPLLEGD